MAKIIAGVADIEAARQLAPGAQADPRPWTLIAPGGVAATVGLVNGRIAAWADADLDPGQARRLALALLEHADKAEREAN